MTIRWAAAARPKDGQHVSGDAYIRIDEEGMTLFMVVDGLGGGDEAAKAATRAVETVQKYANRRLKEIMEHCHRDLHGTRGAVMALLRIDEAKQQITYMGVGNIGVHVISGKQIKPISKNGILGHNQLPSLLELQYQYNPGDIFILYSDGISTRFLGELQRLQPLPEPAELATLLLERYGKPIDDATVLIIASQA